MPLDEDQRALLAAVVDRILPPEQVGSDVQAPALARVEQELAGEELTRWLRGLANEAVAVFGQGFLDMHIGTRDELLDRIEAENCRANWKMNPTAYFGRIIDVVAEAYQRGGNAEAS
ncbi:MAG TPA: gluconate 2-dehydrogenase subunit 3 family protein [Tepidisphaeraceae bacterium]|jgi:hypothetical protein